MPPDSRRHERRARAARAREAQRQPDDPRTHRSLVLFGIAGLVVLAVAVGLFLATRGPAASSPPSAALAAQQAAGVTPVELPTFGADAPQNVLDSTAPQLGTPTAGVAGPTAVVVTNSPWQVLI